MGEHILGAPPSFFCWNGEPVGRLEHQRMQICPLALDGIYYILLSEFYMSWDGNARSPVIVEVRLGTEEA
jgi:hypothetical protein